MKLVAVESVAVEKKAFEEMKAELIRKHPGQFAVVCGRRLLGVFETVDEALLASSRLFGASILPEGAAVYITEIADESSLRVTARPYVRTEVPSRVEGRNRRSVSGEIRI